MTYYKDPLPWNLTDMSISTGVGRTYRYFTGTPLFEFGHGLSLTNFTLKCQQKSDGIAELRLCEEDGRVEYSCDVTNIGAIDGDEVVSSAPSSTIPSVSDSCADTGLVALGVSLSPPQEQPGRSDRACSRARRLVTAVRHIQLDTPCWIAFPGRRAEPLTASDL